MFNFFNVAKSQNELGIEQENEAITDKVIPDETETVKNKPVHGEDGVCCGGCGGQ